MITPFRTALVLAVLALSPAAGAQDMPMHGMKHAPATGAADKALTDSMATMHKDMDVKLTGDADRDFVSMMLPHHEGAVAMARIELKFGKDPTLRKMAEEIISSQDREIAAMKAWRARTGK